jgi:hypothetical protein
MVKASFKMENQQENTNFAERKMTRYAWIKISYRPTLGKYCRNQY